MPERHHFSLILVFVPLLHKPLPGDLRGAVGRITTVPLKGGIFSGISRYRYMTTLHTSRSFAEIGTWHCMESNAPIHRHHAQAAGTTPPLEREDKE